MAKDITAKRAINYVTRRYAQRIRATLWGHSILTDLTFAVRVNATYAKKFDALLIEQFPEDADEPAEPFDEVLFAGHQFAPAQWGERFEGNYGEEIEVISESFGKQHIMARLYDIVMKFHDKSLYGKGDAPCTCEIAGREGRTYIIRILMSGKIIGYVASVYDN